jgi:hypothetical protein
VRAEHINARARVEADEAIVARDTCDACDSLDGRERGVDDGRGRGAGEAARERVLYYRR